MKWAALTLGVAACLWAGRLWARLHRGDVSRTWRAEHEAQRLRKAAEFMGPSHTGKWHR